MLKLSDYTEKKKGAAYRKARQDRADSKMLEFKSEDPEMPWYARDPKEIKRDKRYQQLAPDEKRMFNCMLDELWIGKGSLPNMSSYIAGLIYSEDDDTKRFLGKCVSLGLLRRHEGMIYNPELREQYVRAVYKGAAKDTTHKNEPEADNGSDGDDVPY